MDEEEDRRLGAIAPDVSQISIALLRGVVGLYPEDRVPQEALAVADRVLEEYGTDGLRLLVISLACWAAVEIERDAHVSGRTYESILDEMELTRIEVHPDD